MAGNNVATRRQASLGAQGLVERPGRLEGKVALLVGAGGGIGEATAHRFAEEGAKVMVADIRSEAVVPVAEAILAHGRIADSCAVDVCCDESVQALVAATVQRYGRLDVLFNSAGGSLAEDAPVHEVDLSVWDKTISLDLLGTLLCARHSVPAMIASGGGSIVNMSSGAALLGSGRAHVYAAAKGGVSALTRSLAGAYAKDNIRANAICCGRINTERVRKSYGIPGVQGRAADPFNAQAIVEKYPFWLGEPADIANIALFLASDESRLITGADIPANGGRSAY